MRRSSRSVRRAASQPRRPFRARPRSAARVSRFRMASRRSAVAPTVERILDAVNVVGLDTDQRDGLAVAVAEALSNAAVHGNRLQPGALVVITVEATPNRGAVVDIKDSGPGFDRSALSDPTHPSRILVPGGRGVFLMGRLMDRVEYNEAGNRVRLSVDKRGKK